MSTAFIPSAGLENGCCLEWANRQPIVHWNRRKVSRQVPAFSCEPVHGYFETRQSNVANTPKSADYAPLPSEMGSLHLNRQRKDLAHPRPVYNFPLIRSPGALKGIVS
jgi:hypothetical protein